MKKIQSARLELCLVVLIMASCGFPRLSELADGGSDSDGGSLPFGLGLLAGDIGANGTSAAVSLSLPTGVAVDGAGNVYIAEYGQDTIRKITAAGILITLAGTVNIMGSADGTGAAARFHQPSGVAVDSAGNVYVADDLNFTIRKVTAGRVVTTLAGTAGMSGCSASAGT